MIDRAVQRELIELITSLLQMFQQIDWRDEEQTSIVMDILQDIDDNCRRGLSPVRYEQYSDMLATLEQTIRDTEWNSLGSVETNECRELCREIVDYVLQLVRDEKEIKKEIVFLPYKASMWDSLESVWQAAVEDKEHCNAYVMPIPYADRNPDGSAAQWHCERNEFPDYVPTLDWQQVNLKAWHPDVVFIHNPYDDHNIVTSVDPAYYSHNLKECTDKLIYIPYFVIEELELDYDDPEKEKEVMEKEEKITRFATTPGVLNADYTILQSEATRELYLKALERNTNKTREYWEKRILGIGSPKFDKVVASKREDYVLPQEWRKLLDGRKSILYNTSIGAMLTFSDNYLAKLRSVLETFKSQNDVVLWWRPHPLLRATFQSMHPELLDEYDAIVKNYCREGWGIYDDTTDLDRAIVWTDGYYGDWSSLVHLYQKTGKDVFIQNCKDEHGTALRQFNGNTHFMDVAHHNGYVYFSENSFNGLFRYKEGDNEAEFLGRFPEEDLWQWDLHRNVFVYMDKLYFIPMNGHGISVYDCKNGSFEMLHIPGIDNDYVRFDQCVELDKEIFLIPLNLNTPFVLFNLLTKEIRILADISVQLVGLLTLPTLYEVFSVHCAVKANNCIYLAVSSTNAILKISLDTKRVEKIVLPVEVHIRYMSYIDGMFFFTAKEHLFFSWREETDSCEVYNMPEEAMDYNYPYLKIEKYKDRFYVIPGREDRFWRFSPVTNEWVDLLEKMPVYFEREYKGSLLFLGYRREESMLVLYARSGKGILILDMDKEEFSIKPLTYGYGVVKKMQGDLVKTFFEHEGIAFEWDLDIVDFVRYLSGEKEHEDQDKGKGKDKMTGRVIYKKIIEGENN